MVIAELAAQLGFEAIDLVLTYRLLSLRHRAKAFLVASFRQRPYPPLAARPRL